MSILTVNQAFPALGLPSTPSLMGDILADSVFAHVFRARAGDCTLSGSEILSMTDLKGTGQLLTADSAGEAPALVNSVIGSGLSAAQFVGGSSDGMFLAGAQPSPGAAYTYVLVFQPSSWSTSQFVAGRVDSGSARSYISPQSANQADFNVDGSGVVIGGVVTTGAWNVLLAGYDGVSNIHGRCNGVVSSASGVGAQAAISSPFRIGTYTPGATGNSAFTPTSMLVRDVMICNVDLMDGAHAAQLGKVQAYVSTVYGLSA